MAIPFKYTFRNFRTRKLTTIITIVGISLVVFVFAAVLMMAYGVEKTLSVTGSKENIKVVRKSSQGEITSIVEGDLVNLIKTLPHIAKDSNDKQLISSEPVVIINLEIKTGGLSNISVRGIDQTAFQLRPNIKIVAGRNFNPLMRELIVGKAINKKFKDTNIGDKIKFAGDYWTVVGIFESEGNGFESEIWGDAVQLLNAFNRGSAVSTVTLKLDDMKYYDEFKRTFETDKRLKQFEIMTEQRFFEMQSEFLAIFIRVLGTFITVIFSFGAIIGAAITMYASVANRTVEIGTLRALGFSRRSILISFLVESLIIAITGAFAGLVLASSLQFFSLSTINWNSFAELSFSFALNSSIVISSLIFAIVMGILGGFLPALRAARLNIVNALRGG
ncbi:ABC transporter permease [Stygiobacter electus]|jgi:ABC-type antimicrobial peptide transport system permease subunit|uniref:ABC transporter permease n=1 Tax=Stygiobacter electus TaxID=3032292 RepID=A0AAE3TBV7_9BACT|nr:ABC transporter permease [Stygiobacter electus]MDF1610831.1 ABC transporter permease [Stygiobacter electus]